MQLPILLIIKILDLYLWLIIAQVIISWLLAFEVLNLGNKFVYKANMIINQAVNPVTNKIRKYIPSAGGLDFSPMIVIFGIYMIQNILINLAF